MQKGVLAAGLIQSAPPGNRVTSLQLFLKFLILALALALCFPLARSPVSALAFEILPPLLYCEPFPRCFFTWLSLFLRRSSIAFVMVSFLKFRLKSCQFR